jgi:hypothetical protein
LYSGTLAGQSNKKSAAVLAGLLLLFAVSSIPSLLWRTLWYDELLQFYVAALPTAGQVMDALAHYPPTTDPALSYLLSHFSVQFLGASEMAFRLPSFLGYMIGITSLFWFLQKPFGPICAAMGIAGLYVGGSIYYASEGRPYGLVMGAGGLSLLAWQKYRESSSVRWLALLAIALAGGFNAHYFAVLLGLPILAAEAGSYFRTKRINWKIIGTVFIAYASCVFWIPFWNAAFVFRPVIGNRIGAIEFTFGVYPELLATWYLVLVLVIAAWDILLPLFRKGDPQGNALQENAPPFAETLAMVVFVALPFLGFGLASLGSGLFISRYVLTTTVGVAGVIAALLFRTTLRRNPSLLYVALCTVSLIILFHGILQGRWIHGDRSRLVSRAEHLLEGPGPVILDDPYLFLPAFHYIRPALREKLLFPLDRDIILRRIGSGTMELSLGALSRLDAFAGVYVQLSSLESAGKNFQVVETVDHSHAWVLAEFLAAGRTVRLWKTVGVDRIYSVEAKEPPR